MGKYISEHPQLKKVYLGTECEMSANLAAEFLVSIERMLKIGRED